MGRTHESRETFGALQTHRISAGRQVTKSIPLPPFKGHDRIEWRGSQVLEGTPAQMGILRRAVQGEARA